MKPVLGHSATHSIPINVEALLTTRLVLTAISGGGKSYAIRRILEQTHGQVQQIVLDVEGEFYTMRERLPYVLAGKDGDCPAEVRSAGLLATRLLELRVSAIVDIYALPYYDRILFVKAFLESLLSAEKRLFHPCIVVIDEAHKMCPEKGEGEAASKNAVIDLMAQGRKKLLCGILATQRLSKLDKSAVAEAHNMMIGKSILDVDVSRAMKYLGFKQGAELQIRKMARGHFWTFGPAFCDEVLDVLVDDTLTKSPKLGSRMTAPAPPTSEVQAILGRLADLPAEVEHRAQTEKQLREEISGLKRQLREHQKPEVDQAQIARQVEAAVNKHKRGIAQAAKKASEMLAAIPERVLTVRELMEPLWMDVRSVSPVEVAARPNQSFKAPEFSPQKLESGNGHQHPVAVGELRAPINLGARRILSVLCQWGRGMLEGQMRAQAALKKSGTYSTYMSALKSNGFIERRDGLVFATDAGRAFIGDDALRAPETTAEVVAVWEKKLGLGARKMLQVLIAHRGVPITLDDLAQQSSLSRSGTFSTYLSSLRTAGLIRTESGMVSANKDELFLCE